jgi:DNA-binding response OmpR family regulator
VVAERVSAYVWGARGVGDKELLKQLVHRLRRKVESDPADPRRLLADLGAGFRLVV